MNNQNPEMNLPHMKNTTINPEPNKIRPMVESWLEKLRLSTDTDPENAKLGINAQEFISWLDRERLTTQELDFVLTHPQVVHQHDIKAAVFRIKGESA